MVVSPFRDRKHFSDPLWVVVGCWTLVTCPKFPLEFGVPELHFHLLQGKS